MSETTEGNQLVEKQRSSRSRRAGVLKTGFIVCSVLVVILTVYTLWLNIELGHARFDFYYVKPKNQKFGVYDLDDELYGMEWMKPYQEGVFDCSEMSASIERYLENNGWHALIICGDSPSGTGEHAWVLVETSEGEYMPIEPTTIEIVWSDSTYFDNYY
ncbi:MAG: hypothetical protein JSV20_05845, partial [Candidatus Bathyarchaeota archaeon]